MSRRTVALLVALVATSAVSCGVEPQNAPEPLPSTTPVVLPPSITREPASIPPPATPAPTPRTTSTVAPTP